MLFNVNERQWIEDAGPDIYHTSSEHKKIPQWVPPANMIKQVLWSMWCSLCDVLDTWYIMIHSKHIYFQFSVLKNSRSAPPWDIVSVARKCILKQISFFFKNLSSANTTESPLFLRNHWWEVLMYKDPLPVVLQLQCGSYPCHPLLVSGGAACLSPRPLLARSILMCSFGTFVSSKAKREW